MDKKLLSEIKRISELLKEGSKGPEYFEEPVPMTNYSSNFGQKRSYEIHPGDDIPVTSGTEVKSPWGGKITVANIDFNSKCGGTIDIDHGNGYNTRFCHMKKVDVRSGDIVKRGQVVGLSGGNKDDVGRGNSKGAHLHWTLMLDGKTVDPMEYLSKEIPKGKYDGESLIGTYSSTDEKNKKEDEKLLEKIMDSEYLGFKIKDWLQINKDPLKLIEFIFKKLDR